MNYRELDEMVTWMKEKGVIHMAVDGVVMTLAEVMPIPYPASQSDDESYGDIPDDEPELPQHKIHARRLARLSETKTGTDRTER
jgi:hypothetical protein